MRSFALAPVFRLPRAVCRGLGAAAAAALLAASPARAVISVKPQTTPFIRANDALSHMRLDPKGRFLAFVDAKGLGLSVVDIKSKSIYKVTTAQVGSSFFWAPDGYRLFYREMAGTNDQGRSLAVDVADASAPDAAEAAKGKGRAPAPPARAPHIHSTLKAYDAYLNRSVTLDEMPYPTGLLTFDPRDLRMHLMSEKGIRTKRIYFPDERLARWQVAQRSEAGKWIATQSGVLWVTQGGFSMRRLDDDGGKLESFDISPDGNSIAWATAGGRLYASRNGHRPDFVGYGRDPRWHPTKPLILYAGARMVGNRAVNYDLRVSDVKGNGKFLTATQYSDERWPQWHPKGDQILYTMARTTDVFVLDFKQ